MKQFTLYKIYYQNTIYKNECVYLGRTKQPINQRLRGHFFGKPMHRVVGIEHVTKIEIYNCKTEADMYLYEIYYINKLKPVMNCDDRARDELTVELPELEFIDYWPKLMDKWKTQVLEKDAEHIKRRLEKFKRDEARREARRTMKYDEYTQWLEENGY